MTPVMYSWHGQAWQLAQAAIARGAHALLLAGARGLGKFDLALQLGAGYLCAARQSNAQACGSCESCRWLSAGTHPDFALIEPVSGEEDSEQGGAQARARPISVDQIRKLRDLMTLTSHRKAGKIVIIRPAESLNVAASNALLKNLEEPPAGVLFVLVTDRPALLLPTVRSRCQLIWIRLIDRGAAESWLEEQGFQDPGLHLALCGGAPLEAMSIASDPAWGRRRAFLGSLCAEGADAVAVAEGFRELPPAVVLSWLQRWTFDLLLMRACGRARYHVDLSDTLARIAASANPIALSRVHRVLLAMQRHVHHPLNPRLFLEQMLISYSRALYGGGSAAP